MVDTVATTVAIVDGVVDAHGKVALALELAEETSPLRPDLVETSIVDYVGVDFRLYLQYPENGAVCTPIVRKNTSHIMTTGYLGFEPKNDRM